jgi:hypothetical protein
MKRIIYLFGLFLSIQMSHAQKPVEQERIFYEKLDSTWIISAKESYTYDASSRRIQSLFLDKGKEGWTPHGKTQYFYPLGRSDTSRIEIYFEGSETGWGSPEHSIYLADKNGIDKAIVRQYFDSTSGQWILAGKGEFFINEKGNYIYKIYTKPFSSVWKNEDRTLFKYDTKDNLIQESFQVWENEAWQDRQQTHYHYHPDKSIHFTEIYSFDKSTGKFKTAPETRHIFTYDPDGKLIERKIQKWVNGQWVEKYKRQTIY